MKKKTILIGIVISSIVLLIGALVFARAKNKAKDNTGLEEIVYGEPYIIYTNRQMNEVWFSTITDDKELLNNNFYLASIYPPDPGVMAFSEGEIIYYINRKGIVYDFSLNIFSHIISDDMKKLIYSPFIIGKKNIMIYDFEEEKEKKIKLGAEYIYDIDANFDGSVVAIVQSNENSSRYNEDYDLLIGDLVIWDNGNIEKIEQDIYASNEATNQMTNDGSYLFVSDMNVDLFEGTLYLKKKGEEPVNIFNRVLVTDFVRTEYGKDYIISDNGNLIAALSANNTLQVYFQDSEKLTFSEVDSYCISTDGSSIAYLEKTDIIYSNNLYVMKQGQEPMKIVTNVAQIQSMNSDGSVIAYMDKTSEPIDGNENNYLGNLYAMNVDDSNPQLLTDKFENCESTRTGPNAKVIEDEIVYIEYDMELKKYSLWAVQIGGSPILIDDDVATFDVVK